MKLTKEFLQSWTDLMPKDIEQILKNQEDAERWNLFGSLASATRNDKIVERLKKRIESLNLQYNDNKMYLQHELQKILGEEK